MALCQAGLNSDVQLGQRVALSGMAEKQNGQSLVVVSAGRASLRLRWFMVFTSRNTQKTTITKLTTLLMNRP